MIKSAGAETFVSATGENSRVVDTGHLRDLPYLDGNKSRTNDYGEYTFSEQQPRTPSDGW